MPFWRRLYSLSLQQCIRLIYEDKCRIMISQHPGTEVLYLRQPGHFLLPFSHHLGFICSFSLVVLSLLLFWLFSCPEIVEGEKKSFNERKNGRAGWRSVPLTCSAHWSKREGKKNQQSRAVLRVMMGKKVLCDTPLLSSQSNFFSFCCKIQRNGVGEVLSTSICLPQPSFNRRGQSNWIRSEVVSPSYIRADIFIVH